jgi:hypothetical protein
MPQNKLENQQSQVAEVLPMGDKERIVKLTDQEHGIVVNALYDKHNDLVSKKGPFDAVDQVLMKMIRAKQKRRQQKDPDMTR